MITRLGQKLNTIPVTGSKFIMKTEKELNSAILGITMKIREQFPEAKLIASGGVTTVADVDKLNEMGVYGAIIGKAYYEGKIKLEDLKSYTY